METRMSKTSVLVVAAVGLMLMQCGCGAGKVVKTGFLSDYSRLRVKSESSLRYVNEPALAKYSSFIVDTVQVHFHSGADGIEDKTKGKLTQEKIDDLTNYLHSKLVEAIKDSGHSVVHQPGRGVARIRTAITDIDKTSIVTLYPGAKLSGLGLGGAALEAEIVDSFSGEQIAGLVEAQKGSRIPFVGLGKWDAAKQAIDEWGKRLQKRLEESK
jgi:hypothetical protein